MAVNVSLLNANTIENINTNFNRIKTAMQDSVSRSGVVPNFITGDLDLNTNDVLNVGRIDVQEFYMDGQPIVSIPGFEAIIEIAPDIITVANISDEVIAVAANATNVNAVGNNINDVITVSGLAPSLTAIINNSTNINTVAVNIANVNTVAANIVNVNSVALNSTNINAVASNATNINTVASNNTNINTVVVNLPAILDAPNQAAAAANSASQAAASAASVNLPLSPVALSYLRRNAGNTAYENRTPVQVASDLGVSFTKEYISTQQIITAGGTLTLAHGLGVKPKLYQCVIQCVNASQGYSVGDEIPVSPLDDNGSQLIGTSIVPDTTNLVLRFASPINYAVPNKSTGVRSGVANTDWRLIVRAWA